MACIKVVLSSTNEARQNDRQNYPLLLIKAVYNTCSNRKRYLTHKRMLLDQDITI